MSRVMIVDDAALMRTILADLMARAGYEVVASCANGMEALRILRETAPDLVLLDLEMPVIDGLAFLRHARLLTRARIVVLSSVVALGSPRAHEARRLGADAVISKPSGAVSLDLAGASPAATDLTRTLRRVAP